MLLLKFLTFFSGVLIDETDSKYLIEPLKVSETQCGITSCGIALNGAFVLWSVSLKFFTRLCEIDGSGTSHSRNMH